MITALYIIYRTLLCTKTLDAQEEIVDLEYSMEGSLLVIVYQNIGAVYYHCNDGKPELKCSLPEKYVNSKLILAMLLYSFHLFF